jgi:hypothetical protein
MSSSFLRTTREVAEDALYRGTNSSGGGGGSGITQLTGDVLAGPAVGTTPATVVRINGATVPVAGLLVTGNVLQVTGPSALGYAPVNLGVSASVTGLLPVAHIAPGTDTFVLTTTGGVAVWAAPAGGGGGLASVQNITTPGAHSIAGSGYDIFVDLTAAGGDVTINPVGNVVGYNFNVKLIGATNSGFSCTISPLAGGQIEDRSSPGSLTATPLVLTAPGDEIGLTSPDGTNLYY